MGSRTLQCKKACIHNVNYYTLLLPLATMCSKSPANLDTMIDINFYYSTKGRFSAMIHVHHGSGDNGTLCTPGASPGFGRGGARIFFSDLGICMSRSDMLRMAQFGVF